MDISNTDDMIDSRDVIARIEELEGERESIAESVAGEFSNARALADWDAEYGQELAALLALQEEAEGYAPDWRHGAALIRDDYWAEYVEQLCKDIGEIPDSTPAYIVIDWEATAENLKVDYTSVEFDGTTYWVR